MENRIMSRTNQDILNEMHTGKNHAENTKRKFKVTIDSYCGFHKRTLEELLTEADMEEEQKIRWIKRKLKKRLLNYRRYLVDNNYSKQTIQTYMTNLLTLYRYFDFELEKLPSMTLEDTSPIQPKQLPDKEIIRKAVEIAKPRMKAIILLMASSGLGRAEVSKLTIKDYIESTKNYHNGGTIYDIINVLDQLEDVIPIFYLKREKTGKYFTTFCSPEAVYYINDYLRTRPKIRLNDPLFDVEYSVLGRDFNNLNDKLKLGKVRKYNRLRSHMLRKFHASALYNDGMPRDFVNDLQGKTKNSTDESYFFVNEDDLKAEYINHLHALQISQEVEKVTVKSKEFREMEVRNIELVNENKILKEEVDTISERQDELEKLVLGGISDERLREINKLL